MFHSGHVNSLFDLHQKWANSMLKSYCTFPVDYYFYTSNNHCCIATACSLCYRSCAHSMFCV